ncbi:hypothetical protein [Arsukibacterium sp.]|uniref:hypothetical protein n=1 Tax=Arsukibacterium sp. TaxID=1977258 RepID=UPI001BD694AA|nr:hypothetical protein [Arsukibacterium sp.]
MSAINYLSKLDKVLFDEELTDFSWIENLTEYQSYAVFNSKEARSFFKSVPKSLLLEVFLYGVINIIDSVRDYVTSNNSCHGFLVGFHFDSSTLESKIVIDPKAGDSLNSDFRLQRHGFKILSDIDSYLMKVGRDDIVFGVLTSGSLNQVWIGYISGGKAEGIAKYLS